MTKAISKFVLSKNTYSTRDLLTAAEKPDDWFFFSDEMMTRDPHLTYWQATESLPNKIREQQSQYIYHIVHV